MDEIILRKDDKVSSEAEAYEDIESEIGENDIYQIDNMSLDDKK